LSSVATQTAAALSRGTADLGKTAAKVSAFGYPPAVIAFWRTQVRRALKGGAATPFYLFSAQPVAAAMAQLTALDLGRPAVHWLSTKTQPLPALLLWWRNQGRPAEVVSEAEFRLVQAAGFTTDSILVNGPAKQRWLGPFSSPGLRVNFDSLRELDSLLPWAKRDRWRVGLRLCTAEEFDPESPQFPTQFGLTPSEALLAVRRLKRAGLPVETLHFHLRTQVASADCYRRALDELAAFANAAGLSPRHLDIGGGLPSRNALSRGGKRLDAGISMAAFALTVRQAVKQFPSVEEVWLENGRFVSAGSGVLVVRVLDVKERRGLRQLICDGGRTLNALVSVWEQHELLPLRAGGGPEVLTAVHGPTCMAFDQLARKPLARSIRPGQPLLWFDAGAYHLPWETRFSHGLAEVWWHEDSRLARVRAAESPMLSAA
jgi:diaminopimelate decarboxylase